MNESGETPARVPDLKNMKARIELIGHFEDVKRLGEMLKSLHKGGQR